MAKRFVVAGSFLITFLACITVSALAGCPDVPDPYYEDTNGDGIDGDTSLAIFVSGMAGNNANPGTMAQPVQTIAQGIALAKASGRPHVYVAAGTYNEGPLMLANGISVYGQYGGPPDWGRSASNTTTITGVGTAVLAQNLTIETHLEGFTIVANTDGIQRTGYGVRVVGGNGKFFLRYNTILSGNGVSGADGTSGISGGFGDDGYQGYPSGCDALPGIGGLNGSSDCGQAGGSGGAGGLVGLNNASPGSPAKFGTRGGSAGTFGEPGGPGVNGVAGLDGAIGLSGLGGNGYSLVGALYVSESGTSGSAGLVGRGGGGGGGGGASYISSGSGGGGGGGGGCPGTGGGGGQGGGGSIAVLIDSGSAVVDGNIVSTGVGGSGGGGGAGGSGSPGGFGGLPGSPCLDAGVGGNGGRGGQGGRGGDGGGGAGGVSIGILSPSPAPAVIGSANGYSIGPGGAGGPAPNPGAPGVSDSVVGGSITMTPLIKSVVPPSAAVADTITINGMYFDPIPANNRVCFGRGQATVISSSSSALLVKIPNNAAPGHIRLAVGYLETYSPAPFAVIGPICTAVKGDMDANGSLSAADAVLMLNCVFLASGNCDLCFADLNCSGILAPGDVVLELNAVFLGMPFPC